MKRKILAFLLAGAIAASVTVPVSAAHWTGKSGCPSVRQGCLSDCSRSMLQQLKRYLDAVGACKPDCPKDEPTQPDRDPSSKPDTDRPGGEVPGDAEKPAPTPPETPNPPTTPDEPTTPDRPSQPDTPPTPDKPSEPDTPSNPGGSSDAGISSYEQEVVTLVNQQRAKYGLPALTISNQLCAGARLKSEDMHNSNYFSHTSPTYGSPFDMMKSLGISYGSAGENIARGQSTPAAVVNAWMNSEGHRANILSSKYTAIGVGYVAEGNYWTQWFIG